MLDSVRSVRSVAGSAVGCGASSWWVRCSVRSVSGLVLVAGFASLPAASAFARRWAGRLGGGVRVRPAPVGSGFCVSVPVRR